MCKDLKKSLVSCFFLTHGVVISLLSVLVLPHFTVQILSEGSAPKLGEGEVV